MTKKILSAGLVMVAFLLGSNAARADEAIVPIGNQQRFADPPRQAPPQSSANLADDSFVAREPEAKRAPVRFQLAANQIDRETENLQRIDPVHQPRAPRGGRERHAAAPVSLRIRKWPADLDEDLGGIPALGQVSISHRGDHLHAVAATGVGGPEGGPWSPAPQRDAESRLVESAKPRKRSILHPPESARAKRVA